MDGGPPIQHSGLPGAWGTATWKFAHCIHKARASDCGLVLRSRGAASKPFLWGLCRLSDRFERL
eukprot:2037356-Alexandrium_andersonii.AAC.1